MQPPVQVKAAQSLDGTNAPEDTLGDYVDITQPNKYE